MIAFKIFFTVFLIWQLGYWFFYVIKKIFKHKNVFESKLVEIVINYFLGEFLVVLFLLFSSYLFKNFLWQELFLFMISLSLVSIFKISRRHLTKKINFTNKTSNESIIFDILVILLLSVLPFVISFYTGLSAWDARSIWFCHGKCFFYDNYITLDFLRGAICPCAHLDYPPFIPLLSVFFSHAIGIWNEIYNKSFLFFNWLGYLIIINYALHIKNIPFFIRFIMLSLFSYIAASVGLNGHVGVNGYADIHMVMFIFMSFLFIEKFLTYKNNKNKNLNYILVLLFMIFLSSAALIKNEGLVYALILYSLSMYFCRRYKKGNCKFLFINMFIFLAITSSWYVYIRVEGVHNDLEVLNVLTKYSIHNIIFIRFPTILKYYLHVVIKSYYFLYAVLFLYLYHIIFKIKKFSKISISDKLIWSFVIIIHLVLVFIYLNTPHPLMWHLRTSLDRVILIFVPFFIMLCAKGLYLSIINQSEIKNVN